MSRSLREQNLERMLRELQQYASDKNIVVPNTAPPEAEVLSRGFFLAHSTSAANASAICKSDCLLSPTRIATQKNATVNPNSAEAVLRTADYVFVYAAPFRYPATSCGWLFTTSIEAENQEDGVATPFDSGALAAKVKRVDPLEDVCQFLARHELPLPEYRHYLRGCMATLFHDVRDYLEGRDPQWPGPIGLTGGDYRQWTHEVRIPHELRVRGNLEAFFCARKLAADDEIDNMLRWCELQGVDYRIFDAPRGDDFEGLRRECVDYIREKLL